MSKSLPMLDIADMRNAALKATSLLKVMSNPDRLLLLCQLSQGEHCVSELEAALDIFQPTLSQQLAALRNEGLVTTRRAGKQMYYAIASKQVLALLQTLYEQFCSSVAEEKS